jgi:hypothetical protein
LREKIMPQRHTYEEWLWERASLARKGEEQARRRRKEWLSGKFVWRRAGEVDIFGETVYGDSEEE